MVMTDHPSSAGTAGDTVPDARSAASPGWADRTMGGWRWRIRTDWLAFIESADAPRWLALRHDARAELVKTNSLRDVFRVTTDKGVLFAKIARPATHWDRLRRLVLGPDCLREWRAADYARQHGIATVDPVAAAWAPARGKESASILITLEAPDARPLDEYWRERKPPETGSRAETNRLIDAVAKLLACAHHNSFVHTDLHAGNILVSRASDGGFSVRFVDLQAVSIGRQVGEKRATRNLACFGHWFRTNASLSKRVRFLDLYLAWRDRLQPGLSLVRDRRRLLRQLDLAAQAHAAALAAKRDRQALRNGRRFGILRMEHDTTAHVFLWARQAAPGSAIPKAPLTLQWWRKWLTSRMDFFSRAQNTALGGDDGRLRGSFVLELETGESIAVVFRHYRPPLGKRLKYVLFSSPEMQLWKTGNALLNRGIPAARPLAVCERRFCGLLRYALIFIENPRGKPPDDFIDAQMKELPPSKRYRAMVSIAHQIATLFRKLDQEGFVCDNLNTQDLAICDSPASDETPIVVLADYPNLRRVSSRTPLANLRALRQLSEGLQEVPEVSRTDRLRVLKQYLNRIGRPAADWKHVWRELA